MPYKMSGQIKAKRNQTSINHSLYKSTEMQHLSVKVLSQKPLTLRNYTVIKTGGAVHIIANNLVGFTTDKVEGRSTKYASDLAKGFEMPVLHVNADDPVACIRAVEFAYQYRKEFQKDVVIDLVGYRR